MTMKEMMITTTKKMITTTKMKMTTTIKMAKSDLNVQRLHILLREVQQVVGACHVGRADILERGAGKTSDGCVL